LTKRSNDLLFSDSHLQEELIASWAMSFASFGEELYELKKFAGVLRNAPGVITFSDMNVVGFTKIIKKHDKNMPTKKIKETYSPKVTASSFCSQVMCRHVCT
jgi:SPX domain protein involved in polyphosphate accumulation